MSEGVLLPPFEPRAVRTLGPHGSTPTFKAVCCNSLIRWRFVSKSLEGKITVFRAINRKVQFIMLILKPEGKNQSAHLVLRYSPEGGSARGTRWLLSIKIQTFRMVV